MALCACGAPIIICRDVNTANTMTTLIAQFGTARRGHLQVQKRQCGVMLDREWIAQAPGVLLTCAGKGWSLVLFSSGWLTSPIGRYGFWPDPVSYMDMGLLPRADGRRFKEEWLEVSVYSEPVCTWYILVVACFLRFEFSLWSVWSWKKCLAVGLCFPIASRKSKHQINAQNYQL